MDRSRRLSSFLTILFWLQGCVSAQQIPDELFRKAVEFARQQQDSLEPSSSSTLEEQLLQSKSVHALYQVAKSMNVVDPVTSTQIWHHLADENHVLSQLALGFAYAEQDKPRAIAYFVQAGENGPHQAALFNAGRLLVEIPDFPKALAYIRAAALLDTEYATPSLTATCRDAYQKLSQQLLQLSNLALQDAADMFLYASLTDFPKPRSKEEKLWDKAMKALQADKPKEASKHLAKLQGNKDLSDLQLHLLKVIQAHTSRIFDDKEL